MLDWSTPVQSSPVLVQQNWGLVRSRSKNYSDWIGLDSDGPGPDWSIAGLVESLFIGAQNYLYRAGVEDEMKELKQDLKKDIKDVNDNMTKKYDKLETSISNINGNKRIDSLEACMVKLENKVEGLNTKMEKLDLKIEKIHMAKMAKGTGQIARLV